MTPFLLWKANFLANNFRSRINIQASIFSHLVEPTFPFISKISLPKGKLCDIELLKITEREVDEVVKDNQEYYAKIALLMFYLFQTPNDLKTGGSYWKKFVGQLQVYSKEHKKHEEK